MKYSSWTNDKALPRNRLIGEWIIVLACALLTAGLAGYSNAGKQAGLWVFDHSISWLNPDIDPRILIVQIDETSLATHGRWPWPRSKHAEILNRLADAGVAAVGYDVLFTEPSAAADDAALVAALETSKNVVLPAYVTIPGMDGKAYDLQRPLPEFANAARSTGHVNVIFDADGQVRRAQMQVGEGNETMPHMMQALAKMVNPKLPNSQKQLIIAYNRIGSFPSISASQLLSGEIPDSVLKNRIVLVGATAQGLGDVLSVPGPTGSVMPGVEVQANMLNAILSHNSVADAGDLAAVAIAAILLVLVMLTYWWVQPTTALLTTIIIGASILLLSFLLLVSLRLWISPVPLLIGLTFAYPVWNWRRLSALNRFVDQQARALDIELKLPEFGGIRTFGFDSVALAANRLRAVIGELGDRRRFLHDVVAGAPDALCVIDPNGDIVVANQIALQLLGNDSESEGFWNDVMRRGPIQDLDEEEVELADGRTVLIKAAPLPGQNGDSSGFIVRIIDITTRREMERQRNEFLEFLSHDMRAPQANIVRIVNLAQEHKNRPVPLARIRDHAETSLKLADDFVQLARLSVVTPNISIVDLAALADEAADRCFDAAHAKNVRVAVNTDEECVLIDADPWLLMRALCNLLDNAIKYSPDRGVVSIHLFVDGIADNDRSVAICEINDRGPGIAPDRLSALFDRFGPNDVTRGLSAGLGLAFVKKTMDLLNATIECESTGAGTTFRLKFPVADD